MGMTESLATRLTSFSMEEMLPGQQRPLRAVLVWAVGAALVGGLIGLAIEILTNFVAGRPIEWWFVQQSVLSAEAIGLSAVVGTRYALPQLDQLATPLRAGVVLLTLLGGTVAATIFSLILRPGIVFSRPYAFLGLVAANTILALLLGGALIMWESLKRSLARAYEELRVKEAFEREMRLAREVQQDLLPQAPPDLPGLSVAFCCHPAAAVGGDTIEFLDLGGGRLGIAVGDVVGKGIAAALLMANLQALVRAVAPRETSPARVNAVLSEVIAARSGPSRFITFAYLVLDAGTGEVRYSMAGHHPPLVVGPDGVRELKPGGLPLGVMPEMPYQDHADRLGPGETLVMFTDGVVEAPPPEGHEREFGKQRLIDAAHGAHPEGPAAIRDRVLDELARFGGNQPRADDTTLVVVERAAQAPPSGEEAP
jgi:hypothetical protein